MRQTRSNMYVLGAAMALALAGASALGAAATVELHDHATAAGPQVRLQDVAELHGQAALELGDAVVVEFDAQRAQAAVTLADVERVLNARGVNWGKLNLRGFGTCQVERAAGAQEASAGAMHSAAAETPAAQAPAPIRAGTLRAFVVAKIESMTGTAAGDLRIAFAPVDEKTLAQSVGEDRVEIDAQAADASSRVPLVIRRYHDERLLATYRVAADVARRFQAVTAVRDIARGDTISAGNVELREVYVDSGRGRPATELNVVVGRTAACLLRAGAVVFERDAVPALVVHRGDLITVRAIYGDLVVTTIGRALQDGAAEQVVPARHEQSHKIFGVRMTAEGEGVMVAEMSDIPAPEPKGERSGGGR